MPMRPKIMKLPARIRQQLDARLKRSNFGDLDEHCAWLRSRGFSIGKSALGVYALEHPARLAQDFEGMTVAQRTLALQLADQRMKAIDQAVALGAKTPTQAKRIAADLLTWARSRT